MASTILEERLKKVNDLKSFINSVDRRVKALTDELGWSYDSLFQKKKSFTVTCSIHPHHEVRSTRIKVHEEKCQWLKNEYHLNDLPFPENHGQGSYVVFTPEIQEMVIRNSCSQGNQALGDGKMRDVPQTSARLDQDFTRDEKLAMYDHVVANTKRQKLYKEVASISIKDKNEEKILTPLEIAAAERDAKRRRASYRNKVHTNRKTQTEILREVIESQMEALKEEIPVRSSKGKDHRNKHCDVPYRREFHDYKSESSKSEYSSMGYTHHVYEKPYKKSDRDYRKLLPDTNTKYLEPNNESKHKSRKHKRSRSRSLSHGRSKHKSKHRYHHSSHKSLTTR